MASGERTGLRVMTGLAYDALLFFEVSLLVVVALLVLRPAFVLDRLLGTRILDRLVAIVEWIGER